MPSDDYMPATVMQRIVAEIAARLFQYASVRTIERVREGASTIVYRLRCDGEVYYLRILPEVGASFAPEALAHTLLRAQGVAAPDILHVEACHPQLQRSVMVTTAIAGEPVWRRSSYDGDSRRVVRAAGCDLARINRLSVEGFGWIRRDNAAPADRLIAEHPTSRAFELECLEDDLQLMLEHGLTLQSEKRRS
ncbi:MAG TPA: phosphotransferase [Ktedonobacterales bacterium]|nr:phosphotransferase [Ktedonobacterales bacterium]